MCLHIFDPPYILSDWGAGNRRRKFETQKCQTGVGLVCQNETGQFNVTQPSHSEERPDADQVLLIILIFFISFLHSRPIQKKGLMQIRCCWLYSFFYFIFAQPSRLEYDDFWKGQALYHLEQRQNFERRLDLEVRTKHWSFGFTLFFQSGAEEWGAGNKICMQNVYWY